MADEIRVSRPSMSSSPVQRPDMSADSGYYRSPSRAPWVVLVIVVIVLGVLAFVFRDQLFNRSTTTGTASGYQAVFLTNGQVYFGKLANVNGDYATLKEIYYLQVVSQNPIQGTPQTNQQQQQQPQQSLSLVKLGQELHGPVDSMQINRDQILFYEDMKEDGRVMQAIREYQKNPPASNTPAGGQTPTPAPTTPAN